MRLWRSGRLVEAEQQARRLLAVNPDEPGILYLLGNLARDQGKVAESESWYRRCLKVAPHHLGAHANLGGLLLHRGRKHEALACYRASIKMAPEDASLHYNLAQCLRALELYAEAIAAYQRALELKPDFLLAASDLANVLAQAGKTAEAEVLSRELINRHPQAPEPRLSLGAMLRDQGRLAEARQVFEEALRLAPGHRHALLHLASIAIEYHDLHRAKALLQAAAKSGAAKPNIQRLIAEIYARQGDNRAATELMTQVLAAGNALAGDYLKIATWHVAANQRAKAVKVLEDAWRIHGDRSPLILANLFYNQLCLGDWSQYRQHLAKVVAMLNTVEPPPLDPFISLQIPELGPVAIRRITQQYAQRLVQRAGQMPQIVWQPHPEDSRPRIGYLSADFHEHATAFLTAGVFEHHDRERFAVYAYSYGPNDHSPTRRRLETSFEQFREVGALDPVGVAQLIGQDGIDILVDLKGYTRLSRPEILALRPAPIQVNWLGYPGTMGVDFMDYLIVDPWVVPPAEAAAYQEALAYMPHAYAPLDTERQVDAIPSRAQAGLPDRGFVFCCFNNPRKILPDFFYLWCDLLREVPNSVLWLFARQEQVIGNLRREAKQQGIDPERILFAPRVNQAEHLARLTLADLILDTLPYNAHTTTSDALLMGVPVLTCIGGTFPGRVAASLLHAAGLPDLVTQSLQEYRTRALYLANHPEALADLRARLRLAREREPYFDVAGFTRHLEALFGQMWQRHQAGLAPATLDVQTHNSP
jgi:predicted O-linked N-acetylglucosamine transferase (SPINDLY family)